MAPPRNFDLERPAEDSPRVESDRQLRDRLRAGNRASDIAFAARIREQLVEAPLRQLEDERERLQAARREEIRRAREQLVEAPRQAIRAQRDRLLAEQRERDRVLRNQVLKDIDRFREADRMIVQARRADVFARRGAPCRSRRQQGARAPRRRVVRRLVASRDGPREPAEPADRLACRRARFGADRRRP